MSVPPFGDRRLSDDERTRRAPAKFVEGVPLARLIKRELRKSPEIVMTEGPRTPAAERFRRLRSLIHHDHQESPQVILITSALPGEGKSTTAINLALAFAKDDEGAVLLLDGDTRRPTIGTFLDPPPSLGLREIIENKVGLEHALIEIEKSRLWVLPAGEPATDPVAMLASDAMAKLFASLRGRFTRIIVDSPPIVPFTDADVIGAHCDAALMVARSGVTSRPALEQALAAVTTTRLLGIALNDVRFSLADRHRHYDHYYSAYYDRKKK